MFLKRICGLLKARFKMYLKEFKEYNGGHVKKHFKKE